MKVKEAHVKDFKRFSDLSVVGIPASTKLVVLIGPNGSGKSSLMEAFNYWSQGRVGRPQFNKDYHPKVGGKSTANWNELQSRITVSFHDYDAIPQSSALAKKAVYVRSAYRHEAQFRQSTIQMAGEVLDDQKRPPLLIAAETRVSDNYSRLVSDAVKALFQEESQASHQIRDRLIGKVRASMVRVFGDLVLDGPGNPTVDGTFFFTKGESHEFQYLNLSGGEKAAFDLLLDFILKIEHFDDTVYLIDEPELHMHSKLQASLLDEMYGVLPERCQLWIATHSIGMTKRAMEIHQEAPDQVVFLDFGERAFDQREEITPAQVDRNYWKSVFSVTLGDLANLVAPAEVVFCEGAGFDAGVYETIFAHTHPRTEFVSLGGVNEVDRDSVIVGNVLAKLFQPMSVWRVIDRDDRHDKELAELAEERIAVLRHRDIESYLWADEILTRLCKVSGRPEQAEQVLLKKRELLEERGQCGKPLDDVKAVSGKLYNHVKSELALTQCGNNAKEFARITLAPLVTPDTRTFKDLEEDVFPF